MTTATSKPTLAVNLYPKALGLLMTRPKLLLYTFLAAITTCLAMGLILWISWLGGSSVIDWMVNWLGWESVGGFLGGLLKISYALFMLVATFYLFPAVAGIIGLPFYDLLSEEVESAITGTTEDAPFFPGLIQGLKSSLLFLGLRLMVLILGLPLFFIPFLGSILLFLINAGFLRFDFLDVPMARRGWTFQQKWRLLKSQRKSQWTFGITTALLLSIPLLNLFIPPLSVIAGTLLFINLIQADSKQPNDHLLNND